MNVWKKGLGRKAVSAVLALVVGLLGLIGLGSAAFATGPGNIDSEATGSITIHKYQNQGGTVSADAGSPDSTFTGPIEGVTFEVQKLNNIDLSTNAGWAAVKDLDPTTVDQATLDQALTETTDDDGQAVFGKTGTESTLAVGAYLVTETSAPENVIRLADPFIVTIPHNNNGEWIYDVNVFPKNPVSSTVHKTIEEQTDLTLGSVVKFPVTTTAPQMDGALEHFVIRDTLSDALAPVGNGVESVTIDGVSATDSDYAVVNETNGIAVVFDGSVEAKEIVVVFAAEVIEAETINNTAYVYVNHDISTEAGKETIWEDPEEEGIPSNEVTTYWGNLIIQKVDEKGNALSGAKFEVRVPGTDDALSVNGEKVFESDADGFVRIDGLYVGDSVNGNVTVREYAVVEIEAPAGYTLLDTATTVEVKAGQTTEAFDTSITNTKQSVTELPLTGSSGAIVMTIIGLALVGGAAILFTVSRRKAAQQ